MKHSSLVPKLYQFDLNNFYPFFTKLNELKAPYFSIIKETISNKPKKLYELLSKNAPKFIKIKKDNKPSERKCSQQLNSFQQIYHNYNSLTIKNIKIRVNLKEKIMVFAKSIIK